MAASDDEGCAMVAESPRRKVLVAVDESEESMYALSWAIDNLMVPCQSQTQNLVVLLHVQAHPQSIAGPVGPGDPPVGFFLTPEVVDKVKKHQEDISKKVLLRAKTLCDEKHLDVETMVAMGDPRDVICEAVEKLHAEYLIIGSHGYGTFKRVLLGSVSDYCAHNAKCPVVIAKKP